jgi:hypothetical protein
MDRSTFVPASQRDEGFWIGLSMLISGFLVPEAIALGTANLAGFLIGTGALVLAVRVLVATLLILRTADKAWRQGYAERHLET